MNTRTPGPWKVSKPRKGWGGTYNLYEIHWSDEGECVAEIVHKEADARLIAAAPELLAALKEAVEVYGKPGGPWGWLDRARAAIAKATGDA